MTFPSLPPLSVKSLKEECITRLENLILSGQLQIGSRLPSERDLAASLGVSRPVLHEAIVDLASKGLVTISPRRGIFVNDYRVTGSFPLFTSLMKYHEGNLDGQFLASLMNFRMVVETEIARLAAEFISAGQLEHLVTHVDLEQKSQHEPAEILTQLDFDFHLQLALASHNILYPMIFNSSRDVYTNLTGTFFRKFAGTEKVRETFGLHARIVESLSSRQPASAAALMQELLRHGNDSMSGDEG